MKKIKYIIFILIINFILPQKILIPMDQDQNDHLKAYGIAFWSLQNKDPLNWLLNYRGGSFLLEGKESVKKECLIRGVDKEENYLTAVDEFGETADEIEKIKGNTGPESESGDRTSKQAAAIISGLIMILLIIIMIVT